MPEDCETLDAPLLEGTLAITGEPRIGSALGLAPPTNVGSAGSVFVQWLRCRTSAADCTTIVGGTRLTYTPTAAGREYRLMASWAGSG